MLTKRISNHNESIYSFSDLIREVVGTLNVHVSGFMGTLGNGAMLLFLEVTSSHLCFLENMTRSYNEIMMLFYIVVFFCCVHTIIRFLYALLHPN